jgi:hypothetical protein
MREKQTAKGTVMKLFTWGCLVLAILSFVAEIYARGQNINSLAPHTLMFLLVGSGMNIVRQEIEKIKRQLANHSNEQPR